MFHRWKTLPAAMAVGAVFLLAGVGPAGAGHPLGTEDAEMKGKGNAEVEFNCEQAHGVGGARDTQLGNIYTVGLAPKLDLAISFVYLFSKADADADRVRGMGDTEVTLKTSFHNGKSYIPTLGVKAGAVLPTGDWEKGLGSGRASGLFTLIAQWNLDPLKIFANARYKLAGRPIGSPDRDDSIMTSLAGEWEPKERWSVVGEYVWEKSLGSSRPETFEFLVGGKKEIFGNCTFDLGIKWGLTHDSPNVTYLAGITFGLTGGTHAHP